MDTSKSVLDTHSVPIAGAGGPGQVAVASDPADALLLTGDTLELEFLVHADENAVNGAECRLTFDPDYLRVTEMTVGSDLNQIIDSSYDNGSGNITYYAGRLTVPPTSVTGTFSLFSLQIEAVQPVTGTEVAFDEALIAGAVDGNPRIYDVEARGCSIAIVDAWPTATATPTPTVTPTPTATATPTPALGAVYGVTYHDRNENGARDVDEPGVAGVTVQLRQVSVPVFYMDCISDEEGRYGFEGLEAGTYRLDIVSMPARYLWIDRSPYYLSVGPGGRFEITIAFREQNIVSLPLIMRSKP